MHQLDEIHHIALQVKDIAKAVEWYTQNFKCKVTYQDDTLAFLKFANTSLALVLPEQHPYHVAFPCEDAAKHGTPKLHRDGTSSVYIKDLDGNTLEWLQLNGVAF